MSPASMFYVTSCIAAIVLGADSAVSTKQGVKPVAVVRKVFVWECFTNPLQTFAFCRLVADTSELPTFDVQFIPAFGKRYPTLVECNKECKAVPTYLLCEAKTCVNCGTQKTCRPGVTLYDAKTDVFKCRKECEEK